MKYYVTFMFYIHMSSEINQDIESVRKIVQQIIQESVQKIVQNEEIVQKYTNKDDKYTPDILRKLFNLYKTTYIEKSIIISNTCLPIRHQNPPEDVTENITKFIIRNYDNDISCKWAKGSNSC